jgi:hypothetical protein
MTAPTNIQITETRAALQKLNFRTPHPEFVAAAALIAGLLDGSGAPGGPAAEQQNEYARIREGMQLLEEYHERFGLTAEYAASLQEKLERITSEFERDRQTTNQTIEGLNGMLKSARAKCALLVFGALVAAALGWELKNRLFLVLAAVFLLPVVYVGWLALRSCWLIHLSQAACRAAKTQTDEILNDIAILTRLTKDAETVFASEMDGLRRQLGDILDKLQASLAK